METTTVHPAIQQTDTHVAHTYNRPSFVLTYAEGMTVWDADGKAYLDFVAGIAVMALGHSDPGVLKTMQIQAEKLMHVSNLYYTGPGAELAAELCAVSFADRVFFCNSGTEANEACIKFARKYAYANGNTEKTEIVAFSGAFHGRTMGALAVTPKPPYQKPFKPLMPGVTIAPFNDIEAARQAIGPQTCAVIVEPIQGEGGVHPANVEFLQALREACDAHDALLVFDEVQCGLGRTGSLWAHEPGAVQPDLMALAKPLAAGLPIGAALMTERVHQAIEPGDHGSTFAGGPVVSAVASHVLGRVNTPDMLAHVQTMGTYLKDKLAAIESPLLKNVRGRGLMIGFDLEFDAKEMVSAGFKAGFLMVNAGPKTMRLVPPLIVEKEQIDSLIDFIQTYLNSCEGVNNVGE